MFKIKSIIAQHNEYLPLATDFAMISCFIVDAGLLRFLVGGPRLTGPLGFEDDAD